MSRYLVEGTLSVPYRFFFEYDPDDSEGLRNEEDAAIFQIEERFEITFEGNDEYYEIETLAVLKS